MREKPKTELTANELDRIALQVCAECGIKDTGLPSEEVIDLCLKSWNDRFVALMNKHELKLAFEMNVNGDFGENKAEHFQCFSREFFCEVCNLYLEKKKEAVLRNTEVQTEPIKEKPMEYTKGLMEALIEDRKNISENRPITTGHTVNERLNLFGELFEVNVTEKQIAEYRNHAVALILTDLAKQRNQARNSQSVGKEAAFLHQIARIKAQKLITDSDEALIQFEVQKLIYGNQLMNWTEVEFIGHVESQMHLANPQTPKEG